MALISEKDQQFLKDHFAKELRNEVQITYFTQHQSKLTIPGQECLYCKETHDLLEEVAALSDKIHLQVYDFVADKETAKQYNVDKIPATIVGGAGGTQVRFFGIPSGYEFSTLVEGIIDISKGTTDLSTKTKEELQKMDKDVHIQVFVTPT
ncbi:MAG: thioredoxin family protein [Chloroflexi bacterium]|nr:thioredoxin family protein [Chloroflexota bacterium]MCL5074468.1 thioredoxin family protein [Chloroflexota bacterium]